MATSQPLRRPGARARPPGLVIRSVGDDLQGCVRVVVDERPWQLPGGHGPAVAVIAGCEGLQLAHPRAGELRPGEDDRRQRGEVHPRRAAEGVDGRRAAGGGGDVHVLGCACEVAGRPDLRLRGGLVVSHGDEAPAVQVDRCHVGQQVLAPRRPCGGDQQLLRSDLPSVVDEQHVRTGEDRVARPDLESVRLRDRHTLAAVGAPGSGLRSASARRPAAASSVLDVTQPMLRQVPRRPRVRDQQDVRPLGASGNAGTVELPHPAADCVGLSTAAGPIHSCTAREFVAPCERHSQRRPAGGARRPDPRRTPCMSRRSP